jgi:hypothetical protein
MAIDHIDPPELVRYVYTAFEEQWFGCSQIDKPEYKHLLLKLCDPRNGAGKDFFQMKYEEVTRMRLYRLKRSAITRFIITEE